MRATTVLALFTASAVLAQDAPRPDAAAELKRLDGVWEGFVVEGRGEKPDRGPVRIRLTIAGGKMSAVDLGNGNKDLGSGALALDPGTSPRRLDATGAPLPVKREKTFLGVYQLNGDTLRWCVGNKKDQRPDEFRSFDGNYLLVLKRKQ